MLRSFTIAVEDYDFVLMSNETALQVSSAMPASASIGVVATTNNRVPIVVDYGVVSVTFASVNASGAVVGTGSTSLDVTVYLAEFLLATLGKITVGMGGYTRRHSKVLLVM
jgi:hypothetical protein